MLSNLIIFPTSLDLHCGQILYTVNSYFSICPMVRQSVQPYFNNFGKHRVIWLPNCRVKATWKLSVSLFYFCHQKNHFLQIMKEQLYLAILIICGTWCLLLLFYLEESCKFSTLSTDGAQVTSVKLWLSDIIIIDCENGGI